MNKIFVFLKYVLEIFVFPYTLVRLIIEYFLFRKYIKILHKCINSNDDFYQYLEKLDSHVDWLGRIYTVQAIPKPFRDFNDDELYDITMRSLLPMTKILERNVLIDVCSIIINRIDDESYIVCLTPFNFPKLLHYIRMTFISLIVCVIEILVILTYI